MSCNPVCKVVIWRCGTLVGTVYFYILVLINVRKLEHITIKKEVREEDTKLIIHFNSNWLKYSVLKYSVLKYSVLKYSVLKLCRKNWVFFQMLIPLCQILLKSILQISSCCIRTDMTTLMDSSSFPTHHKYKVLKKTW